MIPHNLLLIQYFLLQNKELLSKNNATAERELKTAFGYAVFDNSNVTVLFFGGSSGKGVLYNNKTNQRTYMKMAGANLGVGLGVKNIRTESFT